MSNMLDQAIVDAEALKEVAIKNAEAAIVEKYSDDIKKAVDQLLEQEGPSPEEMMMGGMGAPPGTPGAPGGMDAGSGEAVGPNVPEAHMPEKTVTLNLSELVQEMKMDDLTPSEKQMRELVAEEVTGGEEAYQEEGEEMITISEAAIANILGEAPIPPTKGGSTGPFNPTDADEEDELEEQSKTDLPDRVAGRDQGGRRLDEEDDVEDADDPPTAGSVMDKITGKPGSTQAALDKIGDLGKRAKQVNELKKQLRAYQHSYAKLHESHQAYEQYYAQLYQEAQALHEQNNKFREMLVKTQEKLNEVNVRNAQLHYTNRTLISDSLNERQKDKIVEAIEKAGTVEEAKVIFETLQSAVAGAQTNKEAPKSLNEAINKRSSAFLPRKEEKQSDPSFADRMQRLAGIK